MTDPHGRRLRKLRLSLTRACNYRCLYCMPANLPNPSREGLLEAREIRSLVGTLVDLGIETVRVTGGEPLLRPDFDAVAEALSDLPVPLSLTTNGQFLSRHARHLAACGFRGVNVSLDSLDPDTFRRLTRGGDLSRVLSGIDAALAEGLEVKVNCVVLRGLNDGELADFHDLGRNLGIEVRFLELMKVGPGRELFGKHFLSAEAILETLEAAIGPMAEVSVAPDSTSFVKESLAGVRLGFIASESRPFCGSCSRLRLSAEGTLHPCLFKEDGIDLRGASPDEIRERVRTVAALKPTGRMASVARAMHELGG